MKLRENAGKMLFFVPRTYYAFNKSNSLSEFPDVALNSNIQEFSLKGQRISWLKATIPLSVSMDLPVLGTLYKWNQTVFVLLWLAYSLSILSSRFSHVAAGARIEFNFFFKGLPIFSGAGSSSLRAFSGGSEWRLQCMGFSLQWLLLWSTGSRCTGFSSCGPWA